MLTQKSLIACLVFAAAPLLFSAEAPVEPEPKPSFAEPSLSPDRSEIAFVSGGDIWTVPAAGGEARLLVSHSATESRPLYSPDGKRLAFISTRSGGGDIYVLTLASGELKRVTFDDGNDQLDAWSRDGKWLYYSTSGHDIASMSDIYRISAEGGTPMAVSDDRFCTEFFAAPSPDGWALALNARGFGMRQWWRKGHSHIDESEIWLRREARDGAPVSYERIVGGGAKELWPMWNANGTGLYYVSDRDGTQNIWLKMLGGEAHQITQFKSGRVVWPSISYDGAALVFERDFGIWMLDTASGKAHEVPIVRRGVPAGPGVEHLSLGSGFRNLTLSPDGRKLAFCARGEVFAVSAKEGGEAVRVTYTSAAEENPCWAPDSKHLVYASSRDGIGHLFMYDFTNNSESKLTDGPDGDAQPVFSPDGKSLAFQRGGKQLCVLDFGTKQVRTVMSASFGLPPMSAKRPYVWSPDNRWLAYCSPLAKSFRNICVVPAAGGECKQVSFIPNVFSNTMSWSPDGTFLLLHSGQRTEKGSVSRIDLIPRQQRFREDQFRDLFKDEPPRAPIQPRTNTPTPPIPSETKPPADAPKDGPGNILKDVVNAVLPRRPSVKPVEIKFEGINQRQTMLPLGLDIHSEVISPDGKTAVVTSGQFMYTVGLDDNAGGAKPLVSTGGGKADAQFSPDGREVYYLDNGHVEIVPLDTRTPRTLNITAELDSDFEREKLAVFNQAWSYMRDHFFDSKFNGADWNAVRAEYAPRIAGSRTHEELRRIIMMMLGELNASHLGISGGASSNDGAGRLGLRFYRPEYESKGRLRVTEVIPNGPADISGIKAGDYVLTLDGRAISAHTNLDEMLAHRVGRRTVLGMAANAEGTGKRDVPVRPVSAAAEKHLIYKQWVEQRRAYVAKASGGRLGYVHIADMSENALNQLYVDLDAENHTREGVVIDVRNNDGGFVDPYAIDVLARRPYLTMTPRGQATAPGRTVLGQRALELPTVLVTNQHSLSDAESFTEGYRSLKLGKVVGEPTAGWIIFTSNESLLDGSTLRIPHTRVMTTAGEDMEMHPRPVDIAVTRPVGESYSSRDSQLDAAVESLLKDIGRTK